MTLLSSIGPYYVTVNYKEEINSYMHSLSRQGGQKHVFYNFHGLCLLPTNDFS